ncbi:hypothetical protein LTR41_001244 [Exophiala xenobiotica]|nr:hypothetical protein LTR41_001244 [Exophiala xenobiotica]
MEFYGMTGEKLGVIGQIDSSKSKFDDLPQWKKDLLQKPSVSVRKGIAWQNAQGFDSPYEDTSTLVLTSKTGTFVDIRFPLNLAKSRPLTDDPAFWAFSGVASLRFYEGMPYTAHAAWTHDIDSRNEAIIDEGDLFVLGNGDCVETGLMKNPGTQRMEMYKEYWTSPGVVEMRPCVVARTSEGESRQGVVIRVEDYCQGIMTRHREGKGEEKQAKALVERWERTRIDGGKSEEEEERREWQKDGRSNTSDEDGDSVKVPCMWACREDRRMGDEIVVDGVQWKVVELVL